MEKKENAPGAETRGESAAVYEKETETGATPASVSSLPASRSETINGYLRRYIDRGWAPVALHPKSKRPKGNDWPNIDFAPEDFADDSNVGIKLGGKSGGLVDIDLDWPEARELAPVVLQSQLARFGRDGAPGGHWLAQCPELAKSTKFQLPEGDARFPDEHQACVVELRAGGQTMFPPSTHPTGELVRWEDEVLPPFVDASDLRQRAGLLAFLAVVVRCYPPEGSRDDTCMALAGALLTAGLVPDQVDRFVVRVAELAHDEEANDRGKAARTARRRDADEPTTGLPTLVQHLALPESVVDTFRRWLGIGEDLLVLDPSDPYGIAGKFLKRKYTVDGRLVLRAQQDEFLAYDGAAYQFTEVATIRQRLYEFLRDAYCPGKNEPKPFKPTATVVNNIMDALRARCHVPATSASPPAWIGDEEPRPPGELLACRNGLLHLPSGTLLPPTPDFFTRNALDFEYDPDAPEPERWLAFLEQLWPNDPDSIALLQEVFGYLLTPDTSLQKMFMVIGPKRAGKGTIGRVLTGLVGSDNHTAPTLNSLARNFGLEPLIGKQLALVSDAQLDPRTASSAVGENLRRISGEDSVTIDRKNISAWTGRLPTRFVMLTNELPRLNDNSGALASRFVVLQLQRSFYGQEDTDLDRKLEYELPGILNWAIRGWRSLKERGRFPRNETSEEIVAQLANIGSPVKAFLEERCIVGVDYEVLCNELYDAWCRWCDAEGHRAGASNQFGKKLAAVEPTIKKLYPRFPDGKRRYVYAGVKLAAVEPPAF